MSRVETSLALTDPLLRQIGSLGDQAGLAVFVVGGYVRDLLRGNNTGDVDIVVERDGIGFAEKIAEQLEGGAVVRFEKFGTAMLMIGSRRVEALDVSYLYNQVSLFRELDQSAGFLDGARNRLLDKDMLS